MENTNINTTTNTTVSPDRTRRNRVLFVLIAVVLMGNFLARVMLVAHEWASRADVLLTLAFDVLMLAGLCVMQTRPGYLTRSDEPDWTLGKVLFVCALVAGLGLLGLRFFNGANGWWTGHLLYRLR